jgi:uncharacterized Ntn-hydrolase superfamily protein
MRNRLVSLALVMLLLLAPSLGATWSIVLIDTATGEIAIGSATCLESFDLTKFVPVMVIGRGGAAAQAAIDMGGKNKKKIFDELVLGTPPAAIISIAKQGDLLKASRQYGVVDFSPAAAGFTGGAVSNYKEHRTGTIGTISYAIQGNILAGMAVIDAAEMAVQNSTGMLADRLMAGMAAARLMGGDGRCSCPTGGAQSCGAPPDQFLKSAHIGFMLVGRMGDIDGICGGAGCANGDYWLDLNVPSQYWADPDPVDQLREMYEDFVHSMLGQPDGIRSFARLSKDEVLGDGVIERQLHVALYDLRGQAIESGGATVSMSHAEGSAGLSSLVGVTDHGDGTYTLDLQVGFGAGMDVLAVKVEGGPSDATLYPYPTLTHHQPIEAGMTELSAGSEQPLKLDLYGPDHLASQPFVLTLSASGAVPSRRGPLVLIESIGVFDRNGHAEAILTPPLGALVPLVGSEVQATWFPISRAEFGRHTLSLPVVP